MATFRAALTQLSSLTVKGVRNNYDLDELPRSLQSAQLPALLTMPIEPQADRLFRERQDSLQTAPFSGAAKSVNYSATHLLLAAPVEAGLGLRTHLPRLVDLIDSYTAALAADLTLGDQLLAPARVAVEPGIYPYGEREFYGCAFRHAWLLEIATMTIRYSVAIDRNHDGDFDDAGGEISDRVIELRWRLGMGAAYESMADYGWARISLLNADGAFSPERNRLECGARVRIQSEAAGAVRTHFSGSVSHIEPDEGDFGRKQALIHLLDMQAWLADSPARLSPQINISADKAIARLLDGATLRRKRLAGYCLIDIAGYNLIDSVRIFPPENCGRRLQPGKSRFAYIGDWWRDSTSTREAIADIAASERGRFFVDRDGDAVFLNRHHTLIHHTIAAAFQDDMRGMTYSYGDGRLNQIAVLMTPRASGESGTVVWQLRTPLLLSRRSERLLTVSLVDERDRPLGLLAFEGMEARFQRGLREGGREVRGGGAVEVARLGATTLQLRLTNRARHELYLARLLLYGRPLYRGAPLEVVAADGEGMHIQGLKRLALDLPALSDIETAQAVANYELERRKHPRGSIHTLRVNARDHLPAALSASLFDRVRVSEAQTGHGARDYFIIGEEHHVSAGGTRHEVSWTLEPADSARFVIIDASRIDSQAEAIAPF